MLFPEYPSRSTLVRADGWVWTKLIIRKMFRCRKLLRNAVRFTATTAWMFDAGVVGDQKMITQSP
jgi:hypothetical protein